TGGTQVQVSVGAPDEAGRRPLTVHARPSGASEDEPWRRVGTGAVAPDEIADGGADSGAFDALAQWPPRNAEDIDLTGHYEDLAARGFGYGPAFRGLRRVWRAGDTVFAEVVLPEDLAAESHRYGLHPALLD
ncbi:hypothetical protein G3I76_49430, partial [Streptomyces sp. SID11233]|nr:hypothetical protein [Streptomyces sp. SID11233]